MCPTTYIACLPTHRPTSFRWQCPFPGNPDLDFEQIHVAVPSVTRSVCAYTPVSPFAPNSRVSGCRCAGKLPAGAPVVGLDVFFAFDAVEAPVLAWPNVPSSFRKAKAKRPGEKNSRWKGRPGCVIVVGLPSGRPHWQKKSRMMRSSFTDYSTPPRTPGCPVRQPQSRSRRRCR